MIDQSIINITSGNGGNGIVSGRREKFVPYGGPDGGDGGRGGSVLFVADPNVTTLLSFRYKRLFTAEDGAHGSRAKKHGRDGNDILIPVPIGTNISLVSTGEKLADMAGEGQLFVAARGGDGGRGNTHFASSTNQFPLLSEAGEKGQQLQLHLELKLLADVGIIGLPNAGKSSFLSTVSEASPKIADYPFTTLEPVLGVVEKHNDRIVMVDIPGLIEGAHEGVGLGHEFLRHIERTQLLLHVVDGSALDPLEDYRKVNLELEKFDSSLVDKRQVVAINKSDIPAVKELEKELIELISQDNKDTFLISAATHEGVESLLNRLFEVMKNDLMDAMQKKTIGQSEEIPTLRPRPRRTPIKVIKKQGEYTVVSPRVSRIAEVLDDEDWHARMQFVGYLNRAGVIKALDDAGVMPGDTVNFGRVAWIWE